MKTSESISNLSKALVKAQAAMGAAVKGSKNPFFKSNYSDLPTVMEVVKGPLNENGLLVLQPSAHRDGKNFIDTVIIHGESGEFISSETEVICAKQNDAQNFGAGQTYARRFGLQAMLFIPSEDDDGNTAAGKQAPNKTEYKYQPNKDTGTKVAPINAASGSTTVNVISSAPATTAYVPATTNEVARDETPIVAPLVKSSFRKGTKQAAPTSPITTAPAADGEWGN